jgi:hypothetical protein
MGHHKISDGRESFGITAGACDLIHLANGAAMFAKFFIRTGSPAALLGFLSLVPSQLSAEPPRTTARAEYLPVQAIDYNIGSKSIGGYYVQANGTCSLILMITEKIDLDRSAPLSAARVRLVLQPGGVAGLDSDEGHSLNFTCDRAAAKLLVDEGETSVLVAQQKARLYN